MVNSKAGKQYWDDTWSAREIPKAVDPREVRWDNYVNRRFHEYFCKAFWGIETRGMKLLEIGCARSEWLPYFAREFGFKVYGLDYSEIGCQQARQVLAKAAVEGEVICSDFWSPMESMLETFDVVVSFGVAEHFEDTSACIKAFSRFLKPNGIMVTIIPNMIGLIGLMQKLLNRPVFDRHMLLSREMLWKAHEVSGLEVLGCSYFVLCYFGILNLNGIQTNSIKFSLKNVSIKLLVGFSIVICFFDSKLSFLKENRLLFSYINCKSIKPLSDIFERR